MKEILLSFRRIWSKTVFWFAYFFRIKYETANTTLMVAIVPAMIAVSRGVTYLGQCLYYAAFFNVPVSLIQNTDSVWVSFFKVILCVWVVACGAFYEKIYLDLLIKGVLKIDIENLAESEMRRKVRKIRIINAIIELIPVVILITILLSHIASFSICFLFSFLWELGTVFLFHINAKYREFMNIEPYSKYQKIVLFGFVFALLMVLIIKPYPMTTNEDGKDAAIVYLTNNIAVLEEAEITQNDKGEDVLIIHKNKQEIPSSLTALTYEYQTFDRVDIKP